LVKIRTESTRRGGVLTAHAPAEPHLAAWRRFNQAIGSDGSVGIFYESYGVQAGEYEYVYGNMPRFGLGSIFAHVPASGRLASTRERHGRSAMPATDVPLPRFGAPIA
jgi:hypothetical protein